MTPTFTSTTEPENAPNGLAWKRGPKYDPFPAQEEPLVRYYADDTPSQKRMALALEKATRRALANEETLHGKP